MADEKKLITATYQELVRVQGIQQIVSGGRKVRFSADALKQAPLLDQLGREITNGEPPPPDPMARIYREISLDTGPIHFDGGVPIRGYANGGLFPNGAWNFSGHFHNSGFPSYGVGMAIAVRLRGVAFVLSVQGRVGGSIGGGPRDFDWNTSGTNPALAAALPVDDYDWSWNATANINIGDIINAVVGTLGAVATVVTLL
jgi:hypothetical protein